MNTGHGPIISVGAFDVEKTAQTAHALGRLMRYEEYRQLYNGEHWITKPRPGERRLTLNYCRVFVNKAASYLFGKPVGYDAFELDAPASVGSAVARTVEQYLDRVSDFNALPALDLDVAISAGTYGDGAYTVRWDAEAKMPRVTAVDVRGLDARWRQDDLRTLTWVRQRFYIAPIELTDAQYALWSASMYGGGSEGARYEPLAASEEWTKWTWSLTVGGVVVDSGVNPYGEIPYIIFPNLRLPGEFWGEGDLVDIAAIQRELNERISVFSRILEVAGAPVTVIEGATADETAGLKLGPNQQWTLPVGAKAYVLDLLEKGGSQAHFTYIDLLYRAMHDASEMPRTSFGDSSGQSQARSGVALEVELQPLLHKLARKQLILSSAFVRRAQLILKIARIHGHGELPPVGLRVAWPPSLPQDRDALVSQETLLVGSGIHPPTQAMQLLNEQDPDQLLERVISENERFIAAGLPSPMAAGRAGGAANRTGSVSGVVAGVAGGAGGAPSPAASPSSSSGSGGGVK